MQLYTSIIFNLTVNLVQEGYKLKCAMIICLFHFWCALPWIFGKAPAFEADDSGVEANFFLLLKYWQLVLSFTSQRVEFNSNPF